MEGKKVRIETDRDIEVIACVPIDNEFSTEDFMDINFCVIPNLVLVGRCVYHSESENMVTVEVEQPKVSIDIHLELFNVTEILE
jgi:hypothetical protein